MKKWKLVLAMLSFSFLVGCAQSAAPSSADELASGSAAASSGNKEQTVLDSNETVSDQASLTEKSVPEKSRLETILEVQDEKERASQLFSLLLEDMDNAEVAEAFLKQEAKFSLDSAASVPDEFRKEQKGTFLTKLETYQCKYARYVYWGFNSVNAACKSDKTDFKSIFCYDENNRITYAPLVYDYMPHFSNDGVPSKEVFYHYDDVGLWTGTDRLCAAQNGLIGDLFYTPSTEGWEKTHDKAVYDKEGRLSKVYVSGELVDEFQYNKEGSLTKYKEPLWDTTWDYKYDENGYLSKKIKYVYGEKEYESDYNGYGGFRKAVVSGPVDPDIFGNGFYMPYEVTEIITEDPVGDIINMPISPYDFKDHKITVVAAERTEEYEFLDEPVSWDYLRISVSRQYDDGFMDVYTFLFTKTSDDNEVKMWQQGYALFYVTE